MIDNCMRLCIFMGMRLCVSGNVLVGMRLWIIMGMRH